MEDKDIIKTNENNFNEKRYVGTARYIDPEGVPYIMPFDFSYEMTYDSTKFIDMVKSACGLNEGQEGRFNILNHKIIEIVDSESSNTERLIYEEKIKTETEKEIKHEVVDLKKSSPVENFESAHVVASDETLSANDVDEKAVKTFKSDNPVIKTKLSETKNVDEKVVYKQNKNIGKPKKGAKKPKRLPKNKNTNEKLNRKTNVEKKSMSPPKRTTAPLKKSNTKRKVKQEVKKEGGILSKVFGNKNG
jgi:hypothetical protein